MDLSIIPFPFQRLLEFLFTVAYALISFAEGVYETLTSTVPSYIPVLGGVSVLSCIFGGVFGAIIFRFMFKLFTGV